MTYQSGVKTIEFVCTANQGRSTISRAIAQDYIARNGLEDRYRAVSSGSHANDIKAGGLPLKIKKLVMDAGVKEGICSQAEHESLASTSLEEITKMYESDSTYKRKFDEVAERCRSHYSDEEEADLKEAVRAMGIEKYLDGNFKQTKAREDSIAVLAMGESNLKAIKSIYENSGYSPDIAVLTQYLGVEGMPEVPNAFTKGRAEYLKVVELLKKLVPEAVQKAIDEHETKERLEETVNEQTEAEEASE